MPALKERTLEEVWMSNERVYGEFIEGLMRERKVDHRIEGSFRASVELLPFNRFSPGCDIQFTYVHGIDTFRLTVHADNFLRDGEEHQQGMFPCQFDTKEDTSWKPMEFEPKGRALHVTERVLPEAVRGGDHPSLA